MMLFLYSSVGKRPWSSTCVAIAHYIYQSSLPVKRFFPPDSTWTWSRICRDMLRLTSSLPAPCMMGERICFRRPRFSFRLGLTKPRWAANVLNPKFAYKFLIQFNVSLMDTRSEDQKATDTRGPKTYKIKLRKVAEINPELVKHDLIALSRF